MKRFNIEQAMRTFWARAQSGAIHGAPSRSLRLALLFALSCLSTSLLLADDFIQQWFIAANQAELELRYVLVLWAFSLGLWLVGRAWLSTPVLLLFALMQLVQLSHVSYFGEPLDAADISNMLDGWADVQEAGLSAAADHWHVLPAVLLPYLALVALHLWLPGRLGLRAGGWQLAIGLLLVAAVLAAKPYRATYRGMDSFMSGPTRSALHNSLNAFSYFAVRLAFREPPPLQVSPFQPYTLTPVPSGARHVWLVLADSLRSERLSVFGYERDTTPNLRRLREEGELIVKPGIAAGVSTAVTVANLLNLVREPGQPELLRDHSYNLYRMARDSGFQTFWMSAQESKLLNHAGSRFIDISISREDHPLLFLRRHDHAVVDLLKRQAWRERNFVVINLRTAHLPYEENYDQHREPMERWPVDSRMPREQRFGNAYDNSILYLDDVLAEIIRDFDRLQGERYLLISGDHGQLLGEGGRWGHNDLLPEVVQVPIMVYAKEASSQAMRAIRAEHWVSHHEAGVWLAERLGVRVHNPNALPGEHFNHGNQLFGEKYIQRIRETPEGLVHERPELLSQWLERHNNLRSAGDR